MCSVAAEGGWLQNHWLRLAAWLKLAEVGWLQKKNQLPEVDWVCVQLGEVGCEVGWLQNHLAEVSPVLYVFQLAEVGWLQNHLAEVGWVCVHLA